MLGSISYKTVPNKLIRKLDDKGEKMILVGYVEPSFVGYLSKESSLKMNIFFMIKTIKDEHVFDDDNY